MQQYLPIFCVTLQTMEQNQRHKIFMTPSHTDPFDTAHRAVIETSDLN